MYFLLRKITLLVYKIVYNLHYEGLENVPREGGVIYASNHRSYHDPVLITLCVRKRFAYMAKEELFKNPFFGTLIRVMGAFPIKRGSGDMSAINGAIEKLHKGKNLVIFPEGTRSLDGKVGKGKTGVALIAAKAQVDVIPVAIIFEGKMKFRTKVVVKYGKPICSSELAVSENPVPRELKNVKLKIMGRLTTLVEGDGQVDGENQGS